MNSLYKFPDAFSLCETWLSCDSVLPTSYENYKAFHTVRPSGRGGGVSIYVDKIFNPCKIQNLSFINEFIETCCVKLTMGNCFQLFIISIYRPPNSSVIHFINSLIDILNSSALNQVKIILMGDFNLDLLKDDFLTKQYELELESLGFTPVITKPTRIDKNPNTNPTLLDHIWINFFETYSSGILFFDLTDHFPIFLYIHFTQTRSCDSQFRKVEFRDHSKKCLDNFVKKISSINWDSVLCGDVNEMLRMFMEVINNIYSQTCPIRSKIISNKRLGKPWLTPAILQLVKTKCYYFKLTKLGLFDIEYYKSYKYYVFSLIRKSKQSYYENIFRDSRNDMKRTWSTIRDLLGSSKNLNSIDKIVDCDLEYSDHHDIANLFNIYFTSIGPEIGNSIPTNNFIPTTHILPNQNSFYLSPVQPDEISKIVPNLKKSNEKLNCLPKFLLNYSSDFLSFPLSIIINKSFVSDIFPDVLKIAEVIPIHKGGNRDDKYNYRPISILPLYSKIFEKCMVSRLVSFFSKFNILSPYQFGFQKNKNTIDAIINYVDLMYNSLNSKKETEYFHRPAKSVRFGRS